MASLTSSLNISLLDNVSKPAQTVAQALQDVDRNMKSMAKAMNGTNAPDRLISQMAKLKLSAKDVNSVSAAWKAYAKSAGLAEDSTKWTRAQSADVRHWMNDNVQALRTVTREQMAFHKAQSAALVKAKAEAAHSGGGSGALKALGGAALAAGAYKAIVFGSEMLNTYREFDMEKRAMQAFGNYSNAETDAIVRMAIHGGATTKYNDLQWLEGAKELGARGVKANAVMGILPEAANLGQALGVTLPDAVKQLEGALFAFGRHLETPERARAAARLSADMQTAAAKSAGMTSEDLVQLYKYAANSGSLSGLGEGKVLTFGALGKKVNMGGDEMGVAFRALVSKFLSPTQKGREALSAVGVNYADYQKAPNSLSVGNFENLIAQSYGVKLNANSKAKLEKAFNDKNIFTNDAKLGIAVRDAVKGQIGVKDAKDSNKVVGAAIRFKKNSVESVDANALFTDMMKAMKGGNLALANAIFGEKQGSRIISALGNEEIWNEIFHKIEHPQDGTAESISSQRMAGFDGAVSRFEGAIKNLETAMGRAFDADGNGGLLTNITDKAAKVVQALAEMPPAVQQASAALAAFGAAYAGAKGLGLLTSGFGLSASATALDASAVALTGSAEALTAAAIRSGGASVAGNVATSASTVAGFVGSRLPLILTGVGFAAVVGYEGYRLWSGEGEVSPEDNKDREALPDDFSNRMTGGRRGADLARAKAQAEQAKAAIDDLNTKVKPSVETGSLDEAIDKAQLLKSLLGQINNDLPTMGQNIPSLGKVQRGNFTFGGIQGE